MSRISVCHFHSLQLAWSPCDSKPHPIDYSPSRVARPYIVPVIMDHVVKSREIIQLVVLVRPCICLQLEIQVQSWKIRAFISKGVQSGCALVVILYHVISILGENLTPPLPLMLNPWWGWGEGAQLRDFTASYTNVTDHGLWKR